MKKMITAFLLVSLAVLLGACQGGSGSATDPNQSSVSSAEPAPSSSSVDEPTIYKVGVVSDRAVDIWESVNQRLIEENIQVDPVLLSDYVQPNVALAEGSLDANAYQYIPFLYDFNSAKDEGLIPIGYLSVEPMGIWGQEGIDSIDDVPQGAQVAVIEDPVNFGNSLTHLEKAGLIELDPEAGLTPDLDDIVSNPKQLDIVAMEAGMVPRAISDMALVMPGATAAKESGLKVEDALYFEDTDQTSKLFRLTFVTRPELADDEGLLKVLDYYQTEETVQYANETGDGTFYAGWNNDDDPTEDYLAYVKLMEEKQNP